MAQNGDGAPTDTATTTEVLPAPTRRKRSRLTTIREVRREMAKVYVEARDGTLRLDQATRLVYILVQLSNPIRDSELEDRVKHLEEAVERR